MGPSPALSQGARQCPLVFGAGALGWALLQAGGSVKFSPLYVKSGVFSPVVPGMPPPTPATSCCLLPEPFTGCGQESLALPSSAPHKPPGYGSCLSRRGDRTSPDKPGACRFPGRRVCRVEVRRAHRGEAGNRR